MASITSNIKDGKLVSFRFRYCLNREENGKQVFRTTTWKIPDGLTPSKAERAAKTAAAEWEKLVRAEYEQDLKDPTRVKVREIDSTKTDFVYFIQNMWFPLCVCDGEHKHTTVEFYRNITNKIVEYFKGALLQQITSLQIQRYIIYLRTQYRSKQGKPVSDKTIRHHYCMLTLVFGFAIEQELILKNPMDKVECPKLQKKKVEAFTQEQAEIFFSLLPNCPINFRCMLYLFITTGLRRGELLGLQWGDIDFINLTIEICPYTKKFQSTPPCGGRLSPSGRKHPHKRCFNPRLRAEADLCMNIEECQCGVSIHASVRRQTHIRSISGNIGQFQSTPPCGGRQARYGFKSNSAVVSIHASVRRQTISSAIL